jgi:hypothetical protein
LFGALPPLTPLPPRPRRPQNKRFSDPDVCKHFLCGFCPYEEFRRTKNDCGDCPAAHDDACRAQWEALPDREKERYGYERDLLRWMDRLLVDLRRRIDVNTERLAVTQRPLYLSEDQAALDAMSRQVDELLARAAKLGEEGEVDAAQAATAEADAVRERRAAVERAADGRSGNNATRNLVQSVCPVSGLIINDEESRLRDHHTGRNFNSWRKMHEVQAALLEAARRREGERRGRPLGPPPGVEVLQRRDQDRERERDRDGGRERERPRGDRDHERRRRSRSRSRDRRRRSRSRSRDRGGPRRDRDYRDHRERREREREPRRGRERDATSPREDGERGGREEGEVAGAPGRA